MYKFVKVVYEKQLMNMHP